MLLLLALLPVTARGALMGLMLPENLTSTVDQPGTVVPASTTESSYVSYDNRDNYLGGVAEAIEEEYDKYQEEKFYKKAKFIATVTVGIYGKSKRSEGGDSWIDPPQVSGGGSV